MTKKVVSKTMDSLFVIMVVAKVVAVAYLLGLCGGYENGSITGSQFAIRAALTMLFVIFG